MTLTSKPLAALVVVLILGGIFFSSLLGWWTTESTKVPVAFTDGEFAGQSDPADIRGSYTFGDISKSFAVTPEVLAQAFGIAQDDPDAFAVKELETMYLDSGYEIGTSSVRLFVALYTGLPFDTTDQEIYLPNSATEILLTRGNLTATQIDYLEKYTVVAGESAPVQQPAPQATSVPDATHTTTIEEYTVKGKTTFGELVSWGLPQETIENLMGVPMPDPAVTVKDFAAANGLNFETLKPALQAEIDKLRP